MGRELALEQARAVPSVEPRLTPLISCADGFGPDGHGLAFLLTAACFPSFSRPHLGSVPDFRFPAAESPTDSYSGGAVLRRPQKGRLAALRDEPSKARACVLSRVPYMHNSPLLLRVSRQV